MISLLLIRYEVLSKLWEVHRRDSLGKIYAQMSRMPGFNAECARYHILKPKVLAARSLVAEYIIW